MGSARTPLTTEAFCGQHALPADFLAILRYHTGITGLKDFISRQGRFHRTLAVALQGDLVVGSDRADHGSAQELEPLARDQADAACGGVNEDRLAGLERIAAPDQELGGLEAGLPDLVELVALRGPAHGLSLHAHRPALAQLQGSHRSAQRGRGLEFEEVRPYAPGDDARNIDWRVTARCGRPHTKLFREERERPVWLLADLHPGLYFGSRRQLKSALLLRAAALLAWVAVLGGDRLGALIATGKGQPRIFPPRGREAGVLPVLEALVEAQPQAPTVPDAASLNAALIALRPLLQPGNLVLVLSDFSGLDERTEAALAALAARSEQLYPVKQGKNWGYVDQAGKMVIAPAYGAAEPFCDGLARVKQSGAPLALMLHRDERSLPRVAGENDRGDD